MTNPRDLLDAYAAEPDWAAVEGTYRLHLAPKAFAALRATLDLHMSFQYGDESNEDEFLDPNVRWCEACTLDRQHRQQWPCPTVQAITTALEVSA